MSNKKEMIVIQQGEWLKHYINHRGLAIIRCSCGKWFLEGETYEMYGGRACKLCCEHAESLKLPPKQRRANLLEVAIVFLRRKSL